jgi:glucose/arabinose dehydrogenase
MGSGLVRVLALFLCAALAACSQTDAAQNAEDVLAKRQPAAAAKQPPAVASAITDDVPPEYAALMARCEAAVRREQQKTIAAARLGSALTMATGFAGIGGAITGEAISAGRSLAQAGAESSARTAIEKECMP